ncbi:hypothetical protein B0H11DRAFT_2240233 [Mycena galericulata]|nr:hypothetical protein B0H11DRAFT_2240233 [Mycena galericulata]
MSVIRDAAAIPLLFVPSLGRADTDPTIYECSADLARLLRLEKLSKTDDRFAFLEKGHTLRGGPNRLNWYDKRQKLQFKDDCKM